MTALRFRDDLRVELIGDDRLFLLSERSTSMIDNPVTARVAGLVNGERSAAEIVAALAGSVEPLRAFAALSGLRKAGHVVDEPVHDSAMASYVEGRGGSALRVLEAARQHVVTVVDLAGEQRGGGAIVEALERVGCPVSLTDELPSDAEENLLVVVAGDYLQDSLRELNAARLASRRPWLLVKPVGQQVWLGPRMVPGRTGCWECLAERLTANRQVERYVAGKRGDAAPLVRSVGMLPGAEGLAAAAVAAEVVAVLTGQPTRYDGRMVTVDLASFATADHAHVRLPQCPACGDGERLLLPTSHVDLTGAEATHREDGGYRVCTPEQTVARLAHHISPYLGAVSKLESLGTDEDGVTYSFVAGHNFAMVNDNLDLLRGNMRGQSGGKGRTEMQARASAVCEALERFSGVWTPHVPAVTQRWDQLQRRAIHPNDILMFSPAQFAQRVVWNEDPRHRLHRIPEPFDETRPIQFTPACSLTHREEVLVPAGLVWFGQPDLADHFYAVTDSNGGAAGNTDEEAVLQGLCEVYERDAVAIWWYNRVARPGVDLDSFEDPYVQVLRDFYARLDRDLWVLDISTDLAMPVFAAFSRRNHEVEDLMVGFGAHPDPAIALFRALTELNQFLPFVSLRDDEGRTVYRTNDPATLEWCRTATVENEPWVLPSADQPSVTKADLTRRELPTCLDDVVQWCVDDLAAHDIETIVVNQSRPDVELSVVKVFAPGMRHFWRRTGAGRLYDVPVRLGWRATPLAEADVNPRGVFF